MGNLLRKKLKGKSFAFETSPFVICDNKTQQVPNPYRKFFRGFTKHMHRCQELLDDEADSCSDTEIEASDDHHEHLPELVTWPVSVQDVPLLNWPSRFSFCCKLKLANGCIDLE